MPLGGGSSVGQSIGLIIRGSSVRARPAPPLKDFLVLKSLTALVTALNQMNAVRLSSESETS